MRRILLGIVLLAACAPGEPNKPAAPAATPPTPTTPPQPAPSPATPPTPTAVTLAPPIPATPTAPLPPLAGHRDIRPLGGDAALGCVEMYSACTPDPKGGQQCTSAAYNLDCGQAGQAPGGDKIRCVCP